MGAGLQALIAREVCHLASWLVVVYCAGILGYFGLPTEPPLWICWIAFVAAGALAIVLRGHGVGRNISIAVAVLLLGGAVAASKTALVAAPVLEREIVNAAVSGRIVEIEKLPHALRVKLDQLAIDGLPAARTPVTIRLHFRLLPDDALPGARISFRAALMPLDGPPAPGAYDFRRDAYFLRLGGTGYAFGPVTLIERPGTFTTMFATLRDQIVQRISTRNAHPSGAMLSALIVGDQTALPADDIKAIRDSGLAHLLSISGLHIGLAFGLLFFTLRAGLALIPALALRHDIKKWAVLPAWGSALFYTCLSGLPVPAVRSLVSVTIVSVAILAGRRVLSQRALACAAFLVLMLWPESAIGPSFEMSFAAILALIAGYEALSKYWPFHWRGAHPLLRWPLVWLAGTVCSSLLATSATAPYSLYHFDRLAVAGLLANIFAIPITAAIIMPAIVLALLTMPFGLDGIFLDIGGFGSGLILRVAHMAADLPYAALSLPQMPVWGVLLGSLGLLCLCLSVTRLRWMGTACVMMMIASMYLEQRPDILVGEDGSLFAVRGRDGLLHFSEGRAQKRTVETWLRMNAQESNPGPDDPNMLCDEAGCLYRHGRHLIAIGRGTEAARDDCLHADLVINSAPIRFTCRALMLDRFALWRKGAAAIYLSEDGIRVEQVSDRIGQRPWNSYAARRSIAQTQARRKEATVLPNW
ncbi:MAG TPA: ComEC/Rec2 family competence protein [Dongiaceae bacterium]|jgi:competence protein ComEC|nr:ComEC/Rec2 family competence protein [Dongiaceae bacterium]